MIRASVVVLLTSLSLCAQTPGSLDFRVITTGDAPVAGATVTVEGPGGRTYSGATGRDGHLRLASLAPGVYHFTEFDAPGYVRSPRNFLADLTIHEGHVREFQFELLPAPKLDGTVFDEAGNPVAGATVVAHTPRGDTLGGTASTDAKGYYSMTLNATPDSFLSTLGLPTLVLPGTVQGTTADISVARKSAQTSAPLIVEFQLPTLPLPRIGTVNLYLLPAPPPIR